MCYPCHRTSCLCIYIQFFYGRFIWKCYVNFSFIEFIFVMVKDTYLLTYFNISFGENVYCRSHHLLSKQLGDQTVMKYDLLLLQNGSEDFPHCFLRGMVPKSIRFIFWLPFLEQIHANICTCFCSYLQKVFLILGQP